MNTNQKETKISSFVILPQEGIKNLVDAMNRSQLIMETLREVNKEKLKVDFNTYPFRKQFEIDEDKYNADKKLASEYDFEQNRNCSRFSVLLHSLFNPLKNKHRLFFNNKTLTDYEGLSKQEVIDRLFEEGKGSVTYTDHRRREVTVTKGDFERFQSVKQAHIHVKRFDTFVEKIGSRDFIPFCLETSRYIKIKEGYSKIHFELPKHNMVRKNLSNDIIKLMITEANKYEREDVEVVDYSHTITFTYFTILCKTDKIEGMLASFFRIYKLQEEFIEKYDEPYYTYVSVTKDIGTENRENKCINELNV
ncbi:hypothetical protein P9Z82_06390, partial [Bacillus thuringiensis]|uniref:hypothetical protein n=1 Tax=Bacillus thuringiensis TaxID=1428 RepID=UPI002DB5F391